MKGFIKAKSAAGGQGVVRGRRSPAAAESAERIALELAARFCRAQQAALSSEEAEARAHFDEVVARFDEQEYREVRAGKEDVAELVAASRRGGSW